jgi:catalase
MLAHLVNIHEQVAETVANGLGIDVPEAARAAQPTREDLPASPVLSIIERGPQRFEGRKLGILATDGADAGLFAALTAAVTKAGGVFEIIAPRIAGVTLSDGELVPAKQKIDGGPSVLYDAVALLLSAEGAAMLVKDAPSNDFVRDAYAHCKFIGYTGDAQQLLDAAGIADKLDEACIQIANKKDAGAFVEQCGQLRHWERELAVDLDV